MERYLYNGCKLATGNDTYMIMQQIGAGSSCAAYKAQFNGKDCIVKEYNPQNISFERNKNGEFVIDEKKQKKFFAGMERFKRAYKCQDELRNDDDLKNQTPFNLDLFEANNTLYSACVGYTGNVYSDIICKDGIEMLRQIRICRSIAKTASAYHDKGYLLLDIKPSNIFVMKKSTEIVYIDYDSIFRKDELWFGNSLSYTEDWAASEQLNPYAYDQISERTDIYALGELLFYTIFGRHSTDEEHRGFSVYPFNESRFKRVHNDTKVQRILNEIFKNTLRSSPKNRYTSVQLLIEQLDILEKELQKEQYIINSVVLINKDRFIGRESELSNIARYLTEYKTLFVKGIGGIGKSELVKNYFEHNDKNYDFKLYFTFNGSLERMIADDSNNIIAEFYRDEKESNLDFSKRRLNKLKELLTNNSLIVIDNFDVAVTDVNEDLWKMLQQLPGKLLITTRCDQEDQKQLEITEPERSDILEIYRSHYYFNDEDTETVLEIIDSLYSVPLLVQLIAKQAKAGGYTPAKMLELLKNAGIASFDKDNVNCLKDDVTTSDTIKGHLDKIWACGQKVGRKECTNQCTVTNNERKR